MELTAREKLRRDVRAVVHRACWRRFEGDETAAQSILAGELPPILTDAASDESATDTLRRWLDEDEADFAQALVISDLVARRMNRPAAAFTPASQTAPLPATRSRLGGGASPSVADLLDDMFSQQKT